MYIIIDSTNRTIPPRIDSTDTALLMSLHPPQLHIIKPKKVIPTEEAKAIKVAIVAIIILNVLLITGLYYKINKLLNKFRQRNQDNQFE